MTNKEKLKNNRLMAKYGITLDDYNRMMDEQDEKCYICRQRVKLVVDHSHTSSKVRKLLCNRCNMGIGYFEDDPTLLERATHYVSAFK